MTTRKTVNKTVSPRRLAANRANAQKSTGPKTPEGKARSRCNALTHGLRATDVVLMDDPDEFNDLRDALVHDIQPANTLELLLVDRLAIAHWRLRRAYRHEANSTYDRRVRRETDPIRDLTRNLGLGHGADLPAQLPLPPAFDQLLRYETALNRTISQIMHQLIQLRTAGATLFPPTEAPAMINGNAGLNQHEAQAGKERSPRLNQHESQASACCNQHPQNQPRPSLVHSNPLTPSESTTRAPSSSNSNHSAQSNPTADPPKLPQPPANKEPATADPPRPNAALPASPNPDPSITRRQWRPGEPQISAANMPRPAQHPENPSTSVQSVQSADKNLHPKYLHRFKQMK